MSTADTTGGPIQFRGPGTGEDHPCYAPWCGREVPGDRLMCEPDWDDIPKACRDEIWRAWDSGNGVGTAEFAAAITFGLAAVER